MPVMDVDAASLVPRSDLARQAEAAGDHAAAVPHWRAAMALRPQDPTLILRLMGALERSGCLDEAEAAAREGLHRCPDHPVIALDYGWLAGKRGLWAEAVARWQAAILRFEEEPRLHAALGRGLGMLDRFAEAEALLTAAMARFPGQAMLGHEHAALAMRQGHWDEAVRRWERAAARLPAHAPDVTPESGSETAHVLAQLGHCLRQAGRAAEARDRLAAVIDRLPPHFPLAFERASAEEPDWPAAIPLWQAVVDAFPGQLHGYLGLANALVRGGAPDRAEPVLQAATWRFPEDRRVAHDFAHLATDRRDWDVALARWERLRDLDPASPIARHRIGEARWGATLDTLLEAPPVIGRFAPPADGAPAGALSERDLVMQFESLGENCEFGLVQRYYDAEPLGLLRFAATAPEKLVDALAAGFAGVGEPEHTTLIANPGEYVTADRRYGMVAHTFIDPRAVPAADLFPKQCRRLAFLRRKLLEDLATGDKTFVVLAHADPAGAAARTLLAALRRHGPARLLCVRAGIAGHAPGSVDVAEDGLLFGYLDRYGRGGASQGWDISNAMWLALCRRAHDAIRAGRVS